MSEVIRFQDGGQIEIGGGAVAGRLHIALTGAKRPKISIVEITGAERDSVIRALSAAPSVDVVPLTEQRAEDEAVQLATPQDERGATSSAPGASGPVPEAIGEPAPTTDDQADGTLA